MVQKYSVTIANPNDRVELSQAGSYNLRTNGVYLRVAERSYGAPPVLTIAGEKKGIPTFRSLALDVTATEAVLDQLITALQHAKEALKDSEGFKEDGRLSVQTRSND